MTDSLFALIMSVTPNQTRLAYADCPNDLSITLATSGHVTCHQVITLCGAMLTTVCRQLGITQDEFNKLLAGVQASYSTLGQLHTQADILDSLEADHD